jgi:hypothetical protein
LKKIPYVIYAGDSEQDGSQCGPETVRRIEYGIQFIESRADQRFVVVLAAGTRPDKKEYPPLKEVMRSYLERRLAVEMEHSRLSKMPDIVIAQKDGWGTLEESIAAFEELRRLDAREAYVESSWYHVPRILIIWSLISLRSLKVRAVWAPSPRMFSVLKELASLVKLAIVWQSRKN